jgi:hypothetical protein
MGSKQETSMLRIIPSAAIAFAAAISAAPVYAGDPPSIDHTVRVECPAQGAKTFKFADARRVSPTGTVELETKWYLERTLADQGRSCTVQSVDGSPLLPGPEQNVGQVPQSK